MCNPRCGFKDVVYFFFLLRGKEEGKNLYYQFFKDPRFALLPPFDDGSK